MESIEISVLGTELETVSINLTKEQVENIYSEHRAQKAEIAELKKNLERTESSLKYASEGRRDSENQLDQAHCILDAMGIEKIIEKQYGELKIELSARIALMIKHLLSKA